MRVLSIIDRLCTPGGAERQLVTLARALAARGHQCSIAALFPGSNLASELPAWGIGFHELGVRYRRDLIGAGMKVARLIRENQFDVVQAHLITSSIALGLSKTLVDGPARVVVLHCLDYEVSPATKLRHKALRAVHRVCLRRLTDGIVAVSNSVARHYNREMGIKDITTIQNPIELESSPETYLAGREKLRAALGVDSKTDLLVYSGRLVEQKAHILLLHAMEILRSRGIQPKLMLVGAGPLEANIRAAVKAAGLNSQVIMTGSMPYGQALRHIAAADLYVSSANQEGFPLAPAEAMALGLPVVATSVGGVPELVGDGVSGLLLPPGNPETLADAIARVLSDRNLMHRLKSAAPARIQTHFSPAAIAERWETYFGELIASGAHRTPQQDPAAVARRSESNA